MRLGCPAIVDRGTHIEVDSALCVGCDLCTRCAALMRLKGLVEKMRDTSIMIVRSEARSTLLTSRILGNVGISSGADVKVSEVHGMSSGVAAL